MGGTSTQQQTQSSTTAPREAAQPALTGILGQVGTNLNNTGLTGAENSALGTLEQNGANATSQYAPWSNSQGGSGSAAILSNFLAELLQFERGPLIGGASFRIAGCAQWNCPLTLR
ncbi:hypothetical protein ACH79_07570 [Bradyrhizobium sp. CCBAU 051011]|uniref:hypothetical protein n=1 Tax=Bradyrhizobium sp. CCBAU 051011 TaxID=858422 RepID=UPI001373CFC1|nr:hypothetical protein [Bradyrhizobium sp. CCBAU 051011]QHO72500.1 hypothetical protein ACH79_07570 [Bradyrhizobium sp. CCBAU 051011]